MFWCCFNLDNITVGDNNSLLSLGTGDDAGVLFSKDKTTLYFFPNKYHQRKYQYMVPTTVTKIAAGAFALNSKVDNHVTAVVLPTKLTTIGDFAFNSSIIEGCSSPIRHLTIPNKTRTLGYGCLPNGLQDLVVLWKSTTGADNTPIDANALTKAFTPSDVQIGEGEQKRTVTGGNGISGVNVYVRLTAYSTFSGLANTSYSSNSIDTLDYNIPLTIPAGKKYVSFSRDFPVYAGPKLLNYMGTSYDNVSPAKFYMAIEQSEVQETPQKELFQGKKIRVSHEDAIPARGSCDVYYGAIVAASTDDNEDVSDKRTVYYQIGSNSYQSDFQGTDENHDSQWMNYRSYYNLLVAAPCPMYVKKDTIKYVGVESNGSSAAGQSGVSTFLITGVTYGLKDNEFRRIGWDGYVSARKSILAIPNEWVTGSSQSKLLIVFDDSDATGIKNVTSAVDAGTDKWYTLQGISLSAKPTQLGVYIHNGKKVFIR